MKLKTDVKKQRKKVNKNTFQKGRKQKKEIRKKRKGSWSKLDLVYNELHTVSQLD